MAHLKSNIIHCKQCRAFTLLEVLVALTIIAITLGTIIKTSSDQAANTTYLKQKTIGHWVAVNALNQLLLENEWPALGKSTDSTEMANHEWHWQREVIKTPSDYTRKVLFKVFNDDDLQHKVSHLSGYITHPDYLTSPASSTK
ncbi:MAG: type II secretion system minor pseudopilin GspI [Gammaproteobacteria bacterium]|nr:type II secretion system minor pseudopilin GspI [Gammaproteobacteria bacterium]